MAQLQLWKDGVIMLTPQADAYYVCVVPLLAHPHSTKEFGEQHRLRMRAHEITLEDPKSDTESVSDPQGLGLSPSEDSPPSDAIR